MPYFAQSWLPNSFRSSWSGLIAVTPFARNLAVNPSKSTCALVKCHAIKRQFVRLMQAHVSKQVGRKKALGLSHNRVARNARPSLLYRIPASFLHKSDFPLIQLVGRHVCQLDTINLCYPVIAPAVNVIESLAPAFDL